MLKTLTQIYTNYSYDVMGFGGDKGTRHTYIDLYSAFMAPFRDKSVSLLEVGIASGCSLRMWREFFGPEAKLYGIDIHPACAVHAGPFEAILGDSRNIDLGDAKFDIIIDDGNHEIDAQVATFENLFPRLNAGGIYFIEDINDINRDACVLKSLYPQSCLILDLRHNKLKGDDVLVIYTKPPGG